MNPTLRLPSLPTVLSLLLLAAGPATPVDAAPESPRPPNVVVLLADDLGIRDLGCYGSTFHETPHLDRLAREGVRFTQAYAACPVCSPTRASLLTGRYPQRTGITDYIGAPQPGGWKRNTRLLPAPYRTRMEHTETTLAEVLRGAGYATFFAGKWHLGPEGHWPEDQGFDVNRGGIDRGGPYGGRKYFSPYGNPRLEDGPEGEHLPARLAEETVRFIRQHRDRPFLAYLSFYSVHTPLMAREDLERKYAAKRERLGLHPRWGREGHRIVRETQDHPVYAGMVEAMDGAVGRVLDELDALGLAETTVVVFTSDNGGLSTSEGHPTANHPFRAGKGWLYEGGIREPLLVRYPPVTRPGSVSPSIVTSPDLLPTLCELAGVAMPTEAPVDGISQVPALGGQPVGRDAVYWHYPHYGNQGGAPGGAIRSGTWKLVEHYEDGRRELFDLGSDPSENRDRSSEEPDRVRQLAARLDTWRRTVGAVMPTPNPGWDPDRPDGRSAPPPREYSER